MSFRATSFNHVSVHAVDLDESVRFYEEVFGMEKLPTPAFGFPVQWMRLGDQQFHLFVRENAKAPPYHHIGVNVDDFSAAYQKAAELGIHDSIAFFSDIYELPDGSLQMYLRDPAGNLLEIDCPPSEVIDRSALPEIKKLGDRVEQTGEALHSTLYHARLPEVPQS